MGKQHRVALATTNSWPVATLLQPYVAEVVVSNPMATKAIASSRVKTDKVDAETLAHLLRAAYLPAVWIPAEKTGNLRPYAPNTPTWPPIAPA